MARPDLSGRPPLEQRAVLVFGGALGAAAVASALWPVVDDWMWSLLLTAAAIGALLGLGRYLFQIIAIEWECQRYIPPDQIEWCPPERIEP